MYRSALVGCAALGSVLADGSPDLPATAAWPMRVRIDGIHGQPTAFRVFSRGATLIRQTGRASPLAENDTLKAVTPAQYALDLARGSITIYSSGTDSLRVVVGKNPFGMVHPVAAVGRRFTIRLEADGVATRSPNVHCT
jgi:hypothetical protein